MSPSTPEPRARPVRAIDVVWQAAVLSRRRWWRVLLVAMLFVWGPSTISVPWEIDHWLPGTASEAPWRRVVDSWLDSSWAAFLMLFVSVTLSGVLPTVSLAAVHASFRRSCRVSFGLLWIALAMGVVNVAIETLLPEWPDGPWTTHTEFDRSWLPPEPAVLFRAISRVLLLPFFLPVFAIVQHEGCGLVAALRRGLVLTRGSRWQLASLVAAVEGAKLAGPSVVRGSAHLPAGLVLSVLVGLGMYVLLLAQCLLPYVVYVLAGGTVVERPPSRRRYLAPVKVGRALRRAAARLVRDPVAFVFLGLVVVVPSGWMPWGRAPSHLQHLASWLLFCLVACVMSAAFAGEQSRDWITRGARVAWSRARSLCELGLLGFLVRLAIDQVFWIVSPLVFFSLDSTEGAAALWVVRDGLFAVLWAPFFVVVPLLVRTEGDMPTVLRASFDSTRGRRWKILAVLVAWFAAYEAVTRLTVEGHAQAARTPWLWLGYFLAAAILEVALAATMLASVAEIRDEVDAFD